MKRFFCYFGSKHSYIRHYPAPEGVVCEPFAGSAGYSVAHGVREAVLLDTDERVCSLWDYLIHVRPEEVLALPLLAPGERVSSLDIVPEAKLLLSCWVNTSPWRDKQRSAERMAERPTRCWGGPVRARIAAQVEQIRRWRVICGDYTQAPETDTTFVDPPYMVQGKHYREHLLDYGALGQWCYDRSGLVIACEQSADACWLPFSKQIHASRLGTHGASVACSEVYWTKGAAGIE